MVLAGSEAVQRLLSNGRCSQTISKGVQWRAQVSILNRSVLAVVGPSILAAVTTGTGVINGRLRD